MEFLKTYQLDIMLFMSGICCILTFMTLALKSLSSEKKSILALMEFSSMLLLLLDRASYLYRGDLSERGYFMVRFCNGIVFFLMIFIPFLVMQYLKYLLRNEGGLTVTPVSLRICDGLFVLGTILIIVSQFTGLYYTIDEQNRYARSPGFALSFIVPILFVLIQEATILRYRSRLKKGLVISLLISIALPTVMSVIQIFHYGLSLMSISMVAVVIVFYIYALFDLWDSVKTARENELRTHVEAEEKISAMFEETAEALANAIDAKDRYTHGHSSRVAALSRKIAQKAGFSEKDCDQIYFSALLHDIGKIGVPDAIINKEGKLTPEEFEQIKRHPLLGYQILSSIRQSPSLSIGAHYHHERFDGTGYPEGLHGEDIPETARIIAVADAYDAMTSTRSYRSELSPEKTRQELTEGMGKQFDPKYAQILLDILDNDPANLLDIDH